MITKAFRKGNSFGVLECRAWPEGLRMLIGCVESERGHKCKTKLPLPLVAKPTVLLNVPSVQSRNTAVSPGIKLERVPLRPRHQLMFGLLK